MRGPARRLPLRAAASLAAAAMAAAVVLFACSAGGTGGGGDAKTRATWPRFPADPSSRADRALAVLYSTGNLGPRTTLAHLGYPGRYLFRLHEDHPRLRVVLMSTPASRYSGEGTVLDSNDASSTWRALATDERFGWIELASQGYTHSPPGDSDLDHHEFAVDQSGCNVAHAGLDDPAYVKERFALIRGAYRSLGIPDERVTLIRFPGLTAGPRALEAAAEAGFLASLGTDFVAGAGGPGLLEIPDTRILRRFALSDPLEKGLANGRLTRETLDASEEMRGAVALGISVVAEAARGTGILNLTDTWSETFAFIGGTYPRYGILDAVLDATERTYGDRLWFPGGRELALWMTLVRDARIDLSADGDGHVVAIAPTEGWIRAAGETGLAQASILVELPASVEGVSGVRIRAAGDDAWRDVDPGHYWMQRAGLAVVFPIRGPLELRIVPE